MAIKRHVGKILSIRVVNLWEVSFVVGMVRWMSRVRGVKSDGIEGAVYCVDGTLWCHCQLCHVTKCIHENDLILKLFIRILYVLLWNFLGVPKLCKEIIKLLLLIH